MDIQSIRLLADNNLVSGLIIFVLEVVLIVWLLPRIIDARRDRQYRLARERLFTNAVNLCVSNIYAFYVISKAICEKDKIDHAVSEQRRAKRLHSDTITRFQTLSVSMDAKFVSSLTDLTQKVPTSLAHLIGVIAQKRSLYDPHILDGFLEMYDWELIELKGPLLLDHHLNSIQDWLKKVSRSLSAIERSYRWKRYRIELPIPATPEALSLEGHKSLKTLLPAMKALTDEAESRFRTVEV